MALGLDRLGRQRGGWVRPCRGRRRPRAARGVRRAAPRPVRRPPSSTASTSPGDRRRPGRPTPRSASGAARTAAIDAATDAATRRPIGLIPSAGRSRTGGLFPPGPSSAILPRMDPNSLAEELPSLYRAILDRVAELEAAGRRAEAARMRSSATQIYSRAWDDRARRQLDGAPGASTPDPRPGEPVRPCRPGPASAVGEPARGRPPSPDRGRPQRRPTPYATRVTGPTPH